VLRGEERKRQAFARVCFYIIDNPRRAELVSDPKDWPFAGASVPGYPTLQPLGKNFWSLFWKLYQAARDPDAGKIKCPPSEINDQAHA
jgi:hypothetical protein